MKQRTIEPQMYARCHNPHIKGKVEERASLDIAPVGHEFGSKDYERLTRTDQVNDASMPQEFDRLL